MAHTLLVITRDQSEFERRLSTFDLPNLKIIAPLTDDGIESALGSADIVLCEPPLMGRRLERAPNLKWVQSTFAGIDSLIGSDLRSDYLLTNVKDTYGDVMSEHVVAYILMFEREILENLGAQREKIWRQKAYRPLREKTVGIMGTGSIGRHIARVARGFGSTILGFRMGDGPVEGFDETFSRDRIREFFGRSDYLVCVLPRTAETRHLLDEHAFGCMKPEAVLLSVGRGDNVDEDHLVAALRAGRLRAAVLDVFQKEPLPIDSPLWDCPNIFVTPHISGYSVSDRIFDIFSENYGRFLRGEQLNYPVDFQRGY